jgi:hypothetical protein
MATPRTEVRVDLRFRGPPEIANGGFVSGSLAALQSVARILGFETTWAGIAVMPTS